MHLKLQLLILENYSSKNCTHNNWTRVCVHARACMKKSGVHPQRLMLQDTKQLFVLSKVTEYHFYYQTTKENIVLLNLVWKRWRENRRWSSNAKMPWGAKQWRSVTRTKLSAHYLQPLLKNKTGFHNQSWKNAEQCLMYCRGNCSGVVIHLCFICQGQHWFGVSAIWRPS